MRSSLVADEILPSFAEISYSVEAGAEELEASVRSLASLTHRYCVLSRPERRSSKQVYEPWPPWCRDIIFCRGRSGGARSKCTKLGLLDAEISCSVEAGAEELEGPELVQLGEYVLDVAPAAHRTLQILLVVLALHSPHNIVSSVKFSNLVHLYPDQ